MICEVHLRPQLEQRREAIDIIAPSMYLSVLLFVFRRSTFPTASSMTSSMKRDKCSGFAHRPCFNFGCHHQHHQRSGYSREKAIAFVHMRRTHVGRAR